MAGEANQIRWVGIRPTNPAENIPVDIKAASVGVPILAPAAQNVFQCEPGPWAVTRSGVTRSQAIVSVNAAGTMYTVPANSTLYITGLSISLAHTAAAAAAVGIYTSASVFIVDLLSVRISASGQSSLAQACPMPLVVTTGKIIKLATTAGDAYGALHGWIE